MFKIYSCKSFPIILPDIKNQLNLSQEQVNIAGALLYVGAYIGMLLVPFFLKISHFFTVWVVFVSAILGYAGIFFVRFEI